MKGKTTERKRLNLDRITRAPYSIELKRNSDGTFFARIIEFPGCMTEGDSREHALANLDDAMRLWIRAALADGHPIPPPIDDTRYSGKFVVRVPHSIHRELVLRADMEGVSLNQFVVATLARAVGDDRTAVSFSPSSATTRTKSRRWL